MQSLGMSSQDNTLAAGRELATAGIARRLPRVLFLEPIDPSSGVSPALIAAGLSREGWSTSVWSAQRDNRTPSAAERAYPRRSTRAFENLKLLLGKLRSHDVVHITCDSPNQILRQALPAIVLSRFFGRKPVLHFVSVGVEPLLERHRRWVAPILKLAGCAVAGSRYTLRILARIGLDVRLLPQPLEIDPAVHRIRKNLQPKVLVDTRLEPDLNVTAAIKAFRLVKQKYPRAELVIVGDGPERAHLIDLVAQYNINGVEFHKHPAPNEVTRLYAECDLFLHCPLVDESPTALVRAFAYGLPVVTTDADGLIHMVRDQVSALVVPLGDHVMLSDAMIELVENQELCERLSQQGRAEAEKYLWPRVRQDWVNLYKSMVN
jgi:glycosyltransferase involved in cell wall biosynthesis